MLQKRLIFVAKVLFALLCGILLVVFPSASAQTLIRITGAVILLFGAVQAVLSSFGKKEKPHGLARAILLLCAGVFMLLRTDLFSSLIPHVLTFGVLGYGCLEIEDAWIRHRAKAGFSLPHLIAGGVITAYALILLLLPFADPALNSLFIGIGFLLAATASLVMIAMQLRKKDQPHEN